MSAILFELPSLPLAACRNRPGMFDDPIDGATTDQRAEHLASAVVVCRGHPELVVCEQLPLGWHGIGVMAARVLDR